MKINMDFIIGVLYIFVVLIITASSVNQAVKVRPPGTCYGWSVVLGVALIAIPPFIFGYLAGIKQ
jgi:hypothetical protein